MRIDGTAAIAESRREFDAYQAVAPWELIISLDGRDYPVRRPTLAQVAGLEQMGSITNQQALQLVRSFFEPDLCPSLTNMEVVGVVVSAIVAAWQEIAKKKPAMVAAAISRQIRVTESGRPQT